MTQSCACVIGGHGSGDEPEQPLVPSAPRSATSPPKPARWQ
jgi:hypothetical protein